MYSVGNRSYVSRTSTGYADTAPISPMKSGKGGHANYFLHAGSAIPGDSLPHTSPNDVPEDHRGQGLTVLQYCLKTTSHKIQEFIFIVH